MVGPMVGYGWIHTTPSNQILLYVLVYKQILSYIFVWIKEKKKVQKCMNGGWGQAHPSLEYISGLIMIGCGPG